MARVWIGYSTTLAFKELITRYIDPYFAEVDSTEDEEPVGLLEQNFGADYIQPGDFEVYENTSQNEFSYDYVLELFPFSERPVGLEVIDWPTVKCVFFLKSETLPRQSSDANVTITECLDVKFDWE